MLKDQAATQYLADVACDVLFHYPGPMRRADLLCRVSALVPVDETTLETALAADARFSRTFGRWTVAARATAETRPLAAAITALVEAYGRPMPRPLLVSELCLTRAGSPLQHEELLHRLLISRRDLAVLDECLYLTAWLPRLDANDLHSLLYVNELAQEPAFQTLYNKLTAAQHRQRQVLDTAEAVLKAARAPLHNRALGLILHAHHGPRFDPAETFYALHCDERFVCLSGPEWALQAHERTWLKGLVPKGTAPACDEQAVDAATVLQAPAPQRMKLGADTLVQLHQFAQSLRTPVEVVEAVEDVVGLRPRQRNFPAAMHAVDGALAGDAELSRLRPGVYLRRQGLPPWVAQMPEALRPLQGPLTPDHAGEALVPLADLSPELAALVVREEYQDVGEQVPAASERPPQETTITVAWHHYRCGTLPVRERDWQIIELPPTATMLTLMAPEGEAVAVWGNGTTGLICGLLTWYAENLPPSGGIVALRRTDGPSTLELEYTGETDTAARMTDERLAQLLHLRDRLQRRPGALSEVVAAVLQGQSRGLTFDALWFQLNIVRRTTRHQLASALVLSAQYGEERGRWRQTRP